MSDKPLILVIGATGRTGKNIFDTLLDTGKFRLAALVRPSSQSKPAAETLRIRGAEIRIGDILHDSVEELQSCLSGVDVLISAVSAFAVLEQKNVLEAAKKVGVKRVVPCDFGMASPPGRMRMHDNKLAIRSFVRDLGIPYTFIEVGWWMQYVFPHPLESLMPTFLVDFSRMRYGPGNVKTAVTSFPDIGRFVSRIIADPRTINQYVFCWGEEVSLDEVYPLADRVSGQNLSDLIVPISTEEVIRRIAEYRTLYDETHTDNALVALSAFEYFYSLYSCGDNTLEKAKAAGALDARDLYPDFKPETLEEGARQFYSKVPEYVIPTA